MCVCVCVCGCRGKFSKFRSEIEDLNDTHTHIQRSKQACVLTMPPKRIFLILGSEVYGLKKRTGKKKSTGTQGNPQIRGSRCLPRVFVILGSEDDDLKTNEQQEKRENRHANSRWPPNAPSKTA